MTTAQDIRGWLTADPSGRTVPRSNLRVTGGNGLTFELLRDLFHAGGGRALNVKVRGDIAGDPAALRGLEVRLHLCLTNSRSSPDQSFAWYTRDSAGYARGCMRLFKGAVRVEMACRLLRALGAQSLVFGEYSDWPRHAIASAARAVTPAVEELTVFTSDPSAAPPRGPEWDVMTQAVFSAAAPNLTYLIYPFNDLTAAYILVKVRASPNLIYDGEKGTSPHALELKWIRHCREAAGEIRYAVKEAYDAVRRSTGPLNLRAVAEVADRLAPTLPSPPMQHLSTPPRDQIISNEITRIIRENDVN